MRRCSDLRIAGANERGQSHEGALHPGAVQVDENATLLRSEPPGAIGFRIPMRTGANETGLIEVRLTGISQALQGSASLLALASVAAPSIRRVHAWALIGVRGGGAICGLATTLELLGLRLPVPRFRGLGARVA